MAARVADMQRGSNVSGQSGAPDDGWICFRGDGAVVGSTPAGPYGAGDGHLLSGAEWRRISESLRLSPRQQQVCRCILEGCSDKQVARKAGIALPTVRTHLHRLFQKLNVPDRTGLVLRLFVEFRAVCIDSAAWEGHECDRSDDG